MAKSQRASPVEPTTVYKNRQEKGSQKRTATGMPVHSFTTLINDLGTLTLNQASITG